MSTQPVSSEPAAAPSARPVRRLGLATMAAFGIGQAAEGIKNWAFGALVLFYYQQVIGISGTLAGLALGIALVFDAITDPLAGALSDNAKTRWGRRHPFILAGALPLALTFYGLFNPPSGLGTFGSFVWLTVFAVLVRASMTLYHIPHLALGADMAHDYNQRSTLFAFSTLFGALGGSLSGFFAYRYFFPTTAQFDPGLLNPAGYTGYSVTFAFVMVGAIVFCFLGTFREIPHLRRPATDQKFGFAKLVREVGDVFRNGSFRALFFGMLLSTLILSIEGVFQAYMGVHFWGLRTEQLAFLPLAGLVGLILSVPFTPLITRLLDKKLSLIVPAIIAILNANVLICMRLFDLPGFPDNDSPWILRFILLSVFVGATIGPVIFTSINSMFADIADEHELETGERREGVIFAARAFALKATGAIGLIVGGVLLDFIAFPRGAVAGTVPDDVLWSLGFVQGPATSVFTIGGVLMFLGYRLDRHRHAEIISEIEQRRSDLGD